MIYNANEEQTQFGKRACAESGTRVWMSNLWWTRQGTTTLPRVSTFCLHRLRRWALWLSCRLFCQLKGVLLFGFMYLCFKNETRVLHPGWATRLTLKELCQIVFDSKLRSFMYYSMERELIQHIPMLFNHFPTKHSSINFVGLTG